MPSRLSRVLATAAAAGVVVVAASLHFAVAPAAADHAAWSLDCRDSNALNGSDEEINQPGEDETYTCRVVNTVGAPVSGVAVDAENLGGLNDPDDGNPASTTADYDTTAGIAGHEFCRTDAQGVCQATIDAAESETDAAFAGTICFWIDEHAFDVEDDEFGGGDSDDGGGCAEARSADSDGDATDAVVLGWRRPSGEATSVDLTPDTTEAITGSTAVFTATVYDHFGDKFLPATSLSAELFHGSLGDQDGNSPATPERTCTTTQGSCILRFEMHGTGTTLLCAFLTGQTPAMSGSSGSARCGSEGLAEERLDGRDVAQITWTTAAPGGGSTPDQGYTLVGADGGIFNFGTSEFHGSTGSMTLNQPVIGLANKRGGTGYWLVARDGGIFTFGDAEFFGSLGGVRLNAPVLGMEATPSGKGYFLFAADGGIFTFGDAQFFGSTGSMKLNAPAVGLSINDKGDGYWLVAQDGGIFSFGNVPFHGSTGSMKLNQPVFDMAPTAGDKGYWLVAKDGGVFSFGDAESKFAGSAVGSASGTVIGMGTTPTSNGYWIADSAGGVYPFGDARALGDRRGQAANAVFVGFATVPRG